MTVKSVRLTSDWDAWDGIATLLNVHAWDCSLLSTLIQACSEISL